ncbi:MAG: SET domain-containing protein, partial [Bacteroidota bacterium]|nr:SET domain-containing protein [Bacteroidota bacterium]
MDPRSGEARYANDAAGLVRVKGLRNNSVYTIKKKRVYITAMRNIEPGEEILVGYGKEYWDVVRENLKAETRSKKIAVR